MQPASSPRVLAVFEPLIDRRANALLDEVKATYQLEASQRMVAAAEPVTTPDEFNAALAILLGKGKSVLEIRDFLSGEFTPLPLADVMPVLRAREAAGAIRLVPRSARRSE